MLCDGTFCLNRVRRQSSTVRSVVMVVRFLVPPDHQLVYADSTRWTSRGRKLSTRTIWDSLPGGRRSPFKFLDLFVYDEDG